MQYIQYIVHNCIHFSLLRLLHVNIFWIHRKYLLYINTQNTQTFSFYCIYIVLLRIKHPFFKMKFLLFLISLIVLIVIMLLFFNFFFIIQFGFFCLFFFNVFFILLKFSDFFLRPFRCTTKAESIFSTKFY